MRRRGRIAGLLVAGGVAVSAIVVASGDNGTPLATPTPTATATGTPGGSITCDRTATSTATLTSAVSAATAGQTVCLTSATSYTFTGTTKAITIIAQNGTGAPSPVAATVDFGTWSASPSSGTLVIDGGLARWDSAVAANFTGGDFPASIKNVTFQNFKGTNLGARAWNFDPGPNCNSNVTIDHAHFYNGIVGEANIYIDHTTGEPCDTGIDIKNSLFRHFSQDGVKISGDARVDVYNNKFIDFRESNGGANHTDAIQYNSGNGSRIYGNWIDDCEQAIFGSDGTGSMIIEYNLVTRCVAHWITVGGDSPASTIRFNTIADTGADGIICGNKTGGPATASRTNIFNNVTPGVVLTGGGTTCNPTRNDHNVSPSGQTWQGGGSPTTYAGYCVASGSALTAADDGAQAGICGTGNASGATFHPPVGEGY